VDGKVEYSGVVHDENTRSSVVDVLRSVFGAGNISGAIDVNSRVGPATWLPRLGALLSKFTLPGADVVLEGNGLKVGGWLSDAERSSWLDSIKGLFGGDFSFGFLGDKTSDAVKSAYSRTLAAIDSLQPGYGGKELVDALNLWVVNFDTDSAKVPTDDDTRLLIAKAARAIRQNPEQVLIVISGHTDNTGDEARNKQLSEERAYAVRDALVAAGVPVEKFEIAAFGSDKPVASNDTPYGRFKNRRIEFSVKR
jgi:OOP family OmpA-OmpF porin